MITFEGVNKTYDQKTIVNDISFEIKKNESFCLLGKSGSGKTTLLKMINKLVTPTKGRIRIQGEDISLIDTLQLRRKIGYIIQNVGLFPHQTVAENIAIPLTLAKRSKSDITTRINELINQIGLEEDHADRYPSSLSGGQQQRVGIARAIANTPDIILMDEPFSALDPILREQLQNDFLEMDSLKGTTKVIVTHDIREALKLADRICLIDSGHIQFIGTGNELLQVKDTKVKEFIGDQMMSLQLQFQPVSTAIKLVESMNDMGESSEEISESESISVLLKIESPFVKIRESGLYYNTQELVYKSFTV